MNDIWSEINEIAENGFSDNSKFLEKMNAFLEYEGGISAFILEVLNEFGEEKATIAGLSILTVKLKLEHNIDVSPEEDGLFVNGEPVFVGSIEQILYYLFGLYDGATIKGEK